MLGKGAYIEVPEGSKIVQVFAPIDGKAGTVFETGHAYGFVSKKGVEVLVHIGVDTVNLGGEGFTQKIKQGDNVKEGDLICEYDFSKIKSKAPFAHPIILITSQEDIKELNLNEVSITDTVFKV